MMVMMMMFYITSFRLSLKGLNTTIYVNVHTASPSPLELDISQTRTSCSACCTWTHIRHRLINSIILFMFIVLCSHFCTRAAFCQPFFYKRILYCIVLMMVIMVVLVAKDGKRIAESPRCKLISEEDHYTLLIYEVRPEDAGKYDCTVSNKHGKAACSARLNVVGMDWTPRSFFASLWFSLYCYSVKFYNFCICSSKKCCRYNESQEI